MNSIQSPIHGIRIMSLTLHADSRGGFMETFRKSWFPDMTWEAVQGNRSDSRRGVMRGLHYHLRQSDYWMLMSGRIRVGLYDLRPHSPSFGRSHRFDMTEADPVGVLIPPGVAHGYLALEDSVLNYLVDVYYDNTDEQGVLWNDPALDLDWEWSEPVILSPRDEQNPRLQDIPADKRPR